MPAIVIEEFEEKEAPDPCAEFYFPPYGDGDPREIMAMCIAEYPEFEELRAGEAIILIVMRCSSKSKGGRVILGEMALPKFMGGMGAFAGWLLAMVMKATGAPQPHFIMTLDHAWWELATHPQRCGLVHHELMHCEQARDRDGEPKFDDEGLPMWSLKNHHLEEFCETVERFGDFAGDVTAFVEAARRGGI